MGRDRAVAGQRLDVALDQVVAGGVRIGVGGLPSRSLQQARGRAVEAHYTRGVRLYQEEKLAEAIAAWRVVLDIDPQHANARRNIDQAERLLKALEQRKKK
jgi:hypothetical protein